MFVHPRSHHPIMRDPTLKAVVVWASLPRPAIIGPYGFNAVDVHDKANIRRMENIDIVLTVKT